MEQSKELEIGRQHTAAPSQAIEGQAIEVTHDAVFGEVGAAGPNYRSVGWIGTVALIMKTQVGLGVLSLPAVFDTLGMVPGVICLCVVAFITTWSGYIVGKFKLRHLEVYSIDDAGNLMFGRFGREVFGVVFCLFFIFVAGSAMLSISIALNALSTHGTCTAVFVAVAAIIGATLSSLRTLSHVSWLAWIGLVGILTSIFVVTIAVGVQDRPHDAPTEAQGPWQSDFVLIGNPSFTEAISAISSLVFAYACVPALFSIVSEMRDPTRFTRALVVCQSFVTAIYITIGCVMYYYCGSYIATPALGSAGVTIKKVAYGIAFPGLIASLTLVLHFAAKYIFVRILRDSKHLVSNGPVHWATWLGCTGGTSILAYVIASGIPIFGTLVSLIGAFLGTLLCFQPMGCMWLYDNWAERGQRTVRWAVLAGWSSFVVVGGTFLMVAGTYGSIVGLIESYQTDGGSSAWSCADNSNSAK